MQRTSVYKNLYHYTNWEGLLGILDSQLLWATHFRFLNDYSEIKLFVETKLPNILYPIVLRESQSFLEKNLDKKERFEQEAHALELVVRDEISKFIKRLYDSFEEQIYISSFCPEIEDKEKKGVNENGLLSQWRSYGQDGGFAIVFDADSLKQRLDQEAELFFCHGLPLYICLYFFITIVCVALLALYKH